MNLSHQMFFDRAPLEEGFLPASPAGHFAIHVAGRFKHLDIEMESAASKRGSAQVSKINCTLYDPTFALD